MKTKNLRTLSSIGTIMLLAILFALSGCAAKKDAWGSLKNGMIMTYNYHPDKDLTYKTTSDFDQTMEVMGQEFEITAIGSQVLIMKPIVSSSNDLEYLVTVQEMSSKLSTPRGDMEAKTEDILGKPFNLTVTRLGQEIEYSGAEELVYNFGTGDTKNISTDVQAFFPNLPDHPVKPSDSWESTDKITEKSGSGELIINMFNINTFEGLETMNGYDCMKINVVFTGTLEGLGEQDGMELITEGEVSGVATWYFAYKEGIFVNNVVEGSGNTTTQVIGPQEMTIPASRVYTVRTELVEL